MGMWLVPLHVFRFLYAIVSSAAPLAKADKGKMALLLDEFRKNTNCWVYAHSGPRRYAGTAKRLR